MGRSEGIHIVPPVDRRTERKTMIKRTLIIGLQILVIIPTLALTLAALVGFVILHYLAGLHNEKS
jgi:hypothetical protein